ncbi:MAG: right-handed parallel beta-helix repeat-containing protein [Verrucomicrobiaceae bacterium]|nr:right-handed parallel beta-helix repeat-containing protein [Verrucomicrobiaceae bacterium]
MLALVVGSVRAQEIRRTPLVLSTSGTAEEPFVFDGHGMIIDLGIDVTAHDWQKQGDLWSSRPEFEKSAAAADVQRAPLFIDEVPLRLVRDRAAEQKAGVAGQVIYAAPEALKAGQAGFSPDGVLYFRWPVGKDPAKAKLILPQPGLASGVSFAGNFITVRNVTAIHAANDGFNIHGHRVGIRLENVKAFSNGDEGISAHETVQMDVVKAEIAWNGSSAGGVADVGDSETTYTDCEVHDNLGAAFFFDGKKHRVTNCRIYRQHQDIVTRGDAVVEQSGNVWEKE